MLTKATTKSRLLVYWMVISTSSTKTYNKYLDHYIKSLNLNDLRLIKQLYTKCKNKLTLCSLLRHFQYTEHR